MADRNFSPSELYEAWRVLSLDERVEGFEFLKRDDADDFFLQLSAGDRAELLLALPPGERRLWMRLLAPDDAADVIQEAPVEDRESLLGLLDVQTRREVKGLLDYAEDEAGGLMNTRYSRLRADMTVDEAISYLRKDARMREKTVYYVFVVNAQEHLLGVVSFRDLLVSPGRQVGARCHAQRGYFRSRRFRPRGFEQTFHATSSLDDTDCRCRGANQGRRQCRRYRRCRPRGSDRDIQKIGGVETLEGPYLEVPLLMMIRKRAGWLAALFLGEMLTATAMGQFETEIARAVVLALFVPLIISSGGNSGSQATTLVIRAMALGEVRLRDWWRVIRREVVTGFGLGAILACIGLIRILLWQFLFNAYGEHYFLVALTVALSLVGVVLWGSLAGSILPFILRGMGFDPASASAPFVATLVDVTGLVIYFTIAAGVLSGTLL
jgi:magnesium transporter